MIITAGYLKGKNIICPAGKDIRPTSSKIRQAIFNILYSMGVELNDTRLLELFSGTGIVSLEAISRGVSGAMLVDNSINSINSSQKNIKTLGLEKKVTIIKQDAIEFIESRDLYSFDLVYIDPPYRYQEYIKLLSALMLKVNNKAIIMAESNKVLIEENNEIGIEIIKTKSWGETFVTFMRKRNG